MRKAPKTKTLETCESLAMLQDPLTDARSDAEGGNAQGPRDPQNADALTVQVAVKRGHLLLFTAIVVVWVAALTFVFSRRGVVLETFHRRDVTIADQEKLLEKYNSYSATVSSFVERPVEMYMTLVVPVIALRFLTDDVLRAGWSMRTSVVAVGAGGTYLLSNGFSAVNVQVRELPIRSVISAGELSGQATVPNKTSTLERSYPEDQESNPVTNTILRNLILPRALPSRRTCPSRDAMDTFDVVDFNIPQSPWMKSLLTKAVEVNQSMTLVVSEANAPENGALTPDQMPMNASVAAELLVYSCEVLGNTDAWGQCSWFFNEDDAARIVREANQHGYGPMARIVGLLPPKIQSSEQEEREWFLRHSGPTMCNVSDKTYKNASLRSWTMELSRVDIVPGAVWVEAIAVEREMATPRLQPNTSKDGKTGYLPLDTGNREASLMHVSLQRAGDAKDESIDVYSPCVNGDGSEVFLSTRDHASGDDFRCTNQSTTSLLIMSRGKRLVADALIENATISNGAIVRDDKYAGVVVNMREIFSTTVAFIRWKPQNLSVAYDAQCDASDGCMGFDVALPGSDQRLLVNASTLPTALAALPPSATNTNPNPLTIVSVRRPQTFGRYRNKDGSRAIGDVLQPHNIRNFNATPRPQTASCDELPLTRLSTYVNNHVYMERTLQPTYTAAAFFLFQRGVLRDILNQSTKTQTVLGFSANVQDVDVYVYIPWLNVLLTLTGCVLLAVANVAVVIWPLLSKREGTDPLERIAEPHTIANVLLNENAYPPLLVSRIVVDAKETVEATEAEKLMIQALSLQRKDKHSDDA